MKTAKLTAVCPKFLAEDGYHVIRFVELVDWLFVYGSLKDSNKIRSKERGILLKSVDRGSRLCERLIDNRKRLIERDELKSGGKYPIQNTLMDMFYTSVTVVQEALTKDNLKIIQDPGLAV